MTAEPMFTIGQRVCALRDLMDVTGKIACREGQCGIVVGLEGLKDVVMRFGHLRYDVVCFRDDFEITLTQQLVNEVLHGSG